jgi:hypothetical protein
VSAPKLSFAPSERTGEVVGIKDVRLPDELVDAPFYLIHFAKGYSYYDQGNTEDALREFQVALSGKGGASNDLADLQFLAGTCYYLLRMSEGDVTVQTRRPIKQDEKGKVKLHHSEDAGGILTDNLNHAIDLYEKAAVFYKVANQEKWAIAQKFLGIAKLC